MEVLHHIVRRLNEHDVRPLRLITLNRPGRRSIRIGARSRDKRPRADEKVQDRGTMQEAMPQLVQARFGVAGLLVNEAVTCRVRSIRSLSSPRESTGP